MACFQCKMCGGTLHLDESVNVVECEYCGTQQTLPRLTNDAVIALYERAGHFRRNNEFDKAMGIYEQILEHDNTDAEAYWSLVLCSYGIEYVEDPRTHRRMITVNRIQYTSVFDDENYKSALRYADAIQRDIYQAEATEINNIQKNFLQLSQKEEPFDVFICYKESDERGKRTPDSVLAQELYYELTEQGLKVFFARITLEDKLGSAYEPYIFAALNSAKVMVVVGTKAEYFNAVWVRNEWSRYLALIKGGAKKMLIPAYRDMDPYDLPEEFSHLQAQDMSKLGFMQDLVRGIRKLTGPAPAAQTRAAAPVMSTNPAVAPLLKRIQIFLSDNLYEEANEYCEKVLDMDPENGEVYVYQLLAKLNLECIEDLSYLTEPFDHMPAYKNALRYADPDTASRIIGYNDAVRAEKADRERRIYEEQQRKEQAEQQRLQQEAYERQQKQLEQRRYSEQLTLKAMNKVRNKRIFWCVVWFIIWWPVGVYHLVRLIMQLKAINNFKRTMR